MVPPWKVLKIPKGRGSHETNAKLDFPEGKAGEGQTKQTSVRVSTFSERRHVQERAFSDFSDSQTDSKALNLREAW